MICPLAGYLIDEKNARVVAAEVVILLLASLPAPAPARWAIWTFLALDFAARAFSRPSWSPLGRAGSLLLSMAGSTPRRVDAGPKRFAARIGLLFCLALVALDLAGASGARTGTAAALGACAFLESAFGVCVGCHMFTAWHALTGRIRENPFAAARPTGDD